MPCSAACSHSVQKSELVMRGIDRETTDRKRCMQLQQGQSQTVQQGQSCDLRTTTTRSDEWKGDRRWPWLRLAQGRCPVFLHFCFLMSFECHGSLFLGVFVSYKYSNGETRTSAPYYSLTPLLIRMTEQSIKTKVTNKRFFLKV